MKTIDLQTEQKTAVALTRREKLLHWAKLVTQHPGNLALFHMLEHWHGDMLLRPMTDVDAGPNIFSIASADPVFKAAGLQGDSVKNAMDFFEISQDELHEFSCDCGGQITNKGMATRITKLADNTGRRDALTRSSVTFKAAPSMMRRLIG